MKEKTTHSREIHGIPGGLGSIFGNPDSGGAGAATVASGIHVEQLPVADSTVGEIRARFRDRFEIPPGSAATIDGREVDEDTVVRTGQLLSFRHTSGEKGRSNGITG